MSRTRVAFVCVHNSCRSQISEVLGKHLADIPPVDIVVTMGCNVQCPLLPCTHREDWGIDDPSGSHDAQLAQVTQVIADKTRDLKQRIVNK